MRDVPFAFGYFQRKLEKLMLHWARERIPSLKLLLHEEYDRKGSSVKQRSVSKKNKRNQVKDDDVVHQNDEAESKTKTKTRSSKKGSKTALKRAENEDEADREHMLETGGVQILDDDEDEESQFIFVAKKRRKPLKFSREEKNAIREGVEKFGDGCWSLIRDAFPVLHHRTYAKALKVSGLNSPDAYRFPF